jgi:hypothetical protein
MLTLKKLYIAAMNAKGEIVGMGVETAGGHMMIPATQFLTDQDRPYFWGPNQTDMVQAGQRHYQETFFGESMPWARERRRQRISEEEFTIVVREAIIVLT